MKFIGYSCDDKLAVLYDLKFTKSLDHVLKDDGFTFHARMKVALDVAHLMKLFHERHIVLGNIDFKCIMVDEEPNIVLFDFHAHGLEPD